MSLPEVIITTHPGDTRTVQPQEVYPMRADVKALSLLWPDGTRYTVNVREQNFVINGGTYRVRIQSPEIIFVRRFSTQIVANQKPRTKDPIYFIGITGVNEQHAHVETMLQISPDGKSWSWCTSR